MCYGRLSSVFGEAVEILHPDFFFHENQIFLCQVVYVGLFTDTYYRKAYLYTYYVDCVLLCCILGEFGCLIVYTLIPSLKCYIQAVTLYGEVQIVISKKSDFRIGIEYSIIFIY